MKHHKCKPGSSYAVMTMVAEGRTGSDIRTMSILGDFKNSSSSRCRALVEAKPAVRFGAEIL